MSVEGVLHSSKTNNRLFRKEQRTVDKNMAHVFYFGADYMCEYLAPLLVSV